MSRLASERAEGEEAGGRRQGGDASAEGEVFEELVEEGSGHKGCCKYAIACVSGK